MFTLTAALQGMRSLVQYTGRMVATSTFLKMQHHGCNPMRNDIAPGGLTRIGRVDRKDE